jgi:hypothetical protein
MVSMPTRNGSPAAPGQREHPRSVTRLERIAHRREGLGDEVDEDADLRGETAVRRPNGADGQGARLVLAHDPPHDARREIVRA